jgi:hypothetical protein
MRPLLVLLALLAVVVGFLNFFGALGQLNPFGGQLPLWLSHPLLMVGMAYLLFAIVFPVMIGRQLQTEYTVREQTLRASGPELAGGRPAGRLGHLNMSAGLLRIQVFPAGVWLRPLFLPPSC